MTVVMGQILAKQYPNSVSSIALWQSQPLSNSTVKPLAQVNAGYRWLIVDIVQGPINLIEHIKKHILG